MTRRGRPADDIGASSRAFTTYTGEDARLDPSAAG